MITTMIFDLDGTLVQTERLKAISYARAAVELCPHELEEAEVVAAFSDVVGLSRREVAQWLVTRFDLTEKAEGRMAELGVSTPWQAYVQLRLRIYEAMLADPGGDSGQPVAAQYGPAACRPACLSLCGPGDDVPLRSGQACLGGFESGESFRFRRRPG